MFHVNVGGMKIELDKEDIRVISDCLALWRRRHPDVKNPWLVIDWYGNMVLYSTKPKFNSVTWSRGNPRDHRVMHIRTLRVYEPCKASMAIRRLTDVKSAINELYSLGESKMQNPTQTTSKRILTSEASSLNVVIGPAAGGKTSVLIHDMVERALNGHSSLFLSCEMTQEAVEERARYYAKGCQPDGIMHVVKMSELTVEAIMVAIDGMIRAFGTKYSRVYIDGIDLIKTDMDQLSRFRAWNAFAHIAGLSIIASAQMHMPCKREEIEPFPAYNNLIPEMGMVYRCGTQRIGSTPMITATAHSTKGASIDGPQHDVTFVGRLPIQFDYSCEQVAIGDHVLTLTALEDMAEELRRGKPTEGAK